jgi:hypothetical protein
LLAFRQALAVAVAGLDRIASGGGTRATAPPPRVYEQDIDDSPTALAALETIMGGTPTEAHDTFSRRGVLHSFCTPDTKKPAEAGFTFPPES